MNPGFGGQSFIATALRKIERARKLIDVKTDNIRRVADAGADTFVAGSAIFGKPDYREVIGAMHEQLLPPARATKVA